MNAPSGHSILLVEENVAVAADLERILKEAGCIVIGPAGSVADALVQIVQRDIEAAVLNVKVGKESTKPVLDVLAFSRVPFVFVSSLSRRLVPFKYRNRPFVSWPCPDDEILQKLVGILPGRGPPADDRSPSV
jgi:two-component SAPR family response regulator